MTLKIKLSATNGLTPYVSQVPGVVVGVTLVVVGAAVGVAGVVPPLQT